MTVNQLLGGRYQFLQTLGSNSPTNTYLVADTYLPEHPKRVVKRLPLAGRGKRAMQFVLLLLRKKAEALKHVGSHEQIPKILAYFEEDNSFYLVEEFIPGRPFSEILKPGKTFPEATVVRLLQEILKILLVLHSWGVIHRCIKPTNIIQRQIDGKLVLTGFGIFKEISTQNHRSPQATSSATFANPALTYVAPDQFQGQRHFSGDIYSVGIIGIQALTGLTAEELGRLRQAGTSNGRKGNTTFGWTEYARVSPAVAVILDRMVAPQAKQRYQTAAEVLEDLRRLTAGLPPEVRQPHPPDPTQVMAENGAIAPQRSSRPWLFSGMGALVVLVLVLGALALRIPQKMLAQVYVRRAADQAQQGDAPQAIKFYTQAIQAFPTSSAHLKRGIAHAEAGEWQAAQQDLTKAVELNPESGLAYYHRGNVRYELGDRQNALADYTEAVQRDPSLTKAYVNRGSVRADLGDEQGAIADYTAALQQDPNLAGAYLNRCLSRSNVGDHQGAIADCSQAIELEPNSVLAYQNRGLVRRRLGDTDGAIKDFNIAIRLDPDDADPYYNRGIARLEIGDTAGAVKDFDQAIERNPDHPFAYYERALVRQERGDRIGAIADLEYSARLCLDAGMVGCYEDAQFQLSQLQDPTPVEVSVPSQ
ncbi:MAG: tetratricopeptide repeat protein [Synechococcales bacterium]|nr:tetratricopeptide repeat protein [Synechococcales bacterium]